MHDFQPGPLVQLCMHLSALTFASMVLGILLSSFWAFKNNQAGKALMNLALPFYVFVYVLKLEESTIKKILAVLVHGAFVIFFFAKIITIVLTPQF